MTCPPLESWLEALDEGAGAPEGAHADCATCAALEREAKELLAALRGAVPRSSRSDEAFVSAVVAAQAAAAPVAAPVAVAATPLPRPAGGRLRFLTWGAAPLAAAALVLLALYPRPPAREDAPVARGEGGAGPWCEVALVKPGGLQFLAEGAHVPAHASLAFRVRHDGPRDAWLGIVAVTERGRVAWYHPAYESAADDPRTLRLAPSKKPRLLPDRVALPLEGKVRVLCWKTGNEWRVRDADEVMERAVAASSASPLSLDHVAALGGSQMGVELWFEAAR